MRGKLMAGVLATALWGGVSLAQEVEEYPSESPEVQTPAGSVRTEEESRGAGVGGAGREQAQQPVQAPDINVNVQDEDRIVVREDDDRHQMRGVTVLLNGGVEGYSGSLAPQIQAGPAWGVTVALKPSKVLGLELGYSGATNEIRAGGGGGDVTFQPGLARGPDIVRNGGRALATLGLTASPVQPYLMGGIGFDRYNVRAEGGNFSDDTVGSVPLGAGIRTHIRGFTADARFGTSLLFNNQFAGAVSSQQVAGIRTIDATRYQGVLSVGASF